MKKGMLVGDCFLGGDVIVPIEGNYHDLPVSRDGKTFSK